jgi:hypothetical protein
MGLYFNKPDTVKLCAKLNKRFSDQNLIDIRSDPDRLAKFNPANNRSLQRIAYKSGLWPTKDKASNKAKRWYKFLKDINDDTTTTTASDIKTQLWSGLTHQTSGAYDYSQLVFTAIEGPAVKFTHQDLPIYNAAGTQTGKALLFVLQTMAVGTGQINEPGPDQGEDTSNEPDDDDDSDV